MGCCQKLGQGQSKTSTKLFIVYHCCIDERVLVNVPCDRLRVSICLFNVYRSDFDLLLARGDLSNDLFLSAKDNKQLFIGAVATAFQIIGITLAGFAYVLLCSIAYLPGFYFYLRACKENNYQISNRQKWSWLWSV